MRYISVCFLVLCSIASCTESKDIPPYVMYRGDFDPKNIACAEETIRAIARKWDFHVEEKDREEKKAANSGIDSFSIFVMAKNKDILDIRFWVMGIGSFVNGEIISLQIHNTEVIPNTEKDKLAQEIVSRLGENCNTKLELYTEPYAKELHQ